jgi:NAD(P)-dependent dehydrogenase (short-subunit alcohol dehydrogenase family)
MSVRFITGTSRGFGRELVSSALAHGDHVVATARNPQRVVDAFPDAGDALLAVPLDVRVAEQAEAAVAAASDRFGGIDVLVNNAGYGLFGAIEEVSDAEVRALFDTNVFGLLNGTRALLPTLRAGAGEHRQHLVGRRTRSLQRLEVRG